MISETLIHIQESLNPRQREEILTSLGSCAGAISATHKSAQPHLLFVSYDTDRCAPHDLINIVHEKGLTAHLVDL